MTGDGENFRRFKKDLCLSGLGVNDAPSLKRVCIFVLSCSDESNFEIG
jgi:hypothetical protein